MKKKITIVTLIIICIILNLSGCLDFISSDNYKIIIYESHPTHINYTISYGYKVNCSAEGKYTIKYNCDIPEVIHGNIQSIITHNNDYLDKTFATDNIMKSWNITSKNINNYNLGITAIVSSKSYMISDLNGKKALKIEEIKKQYPEIFNQYTKEQGNDTIIFIQPKNETIKNTANSILNKIETNNSFVIAKELFKFLKKQTSYKIHIQNNSIQQASKTLYYKTGDCDDLSFLYISLCRSIGIPSRFIKGFIIENEKAIPHAWVEIFIGKEIGKNGWIPIECAGTSENIEDEINQNFGIESASHLRLFKDDGSNESINILLAGLSITFLETKIITTKPYSDINNYLIIKSNQLIIDENNIRSYN